jgi:PAN domain
MRTLLAAVAFAVLVVTVLVWLVLGRPGDAAGAHDPAAISGEARMGPLEQATNRQGRDISEIGLRVTDAAACSRLCAVDERCLAMSFVMGDGAGICWLKGSVPSASESPAVVSAVKLPRTS